VDPDTNSVVAALVVAGATLVVCVATGVWLLSERFARDSARARHGMEARAGALRRDAPGLRLRIDHATVRVDRLREEWAASDQAVTDMTESLVSLRGALEGLTRGRLAILIRGAGIVSKAAQVALLWR
jgi:hypothetical protein